MGKYKTTIINKYSGKKRVLIVCDISFERAVVQASRLIHHSSEEIIKVVLFF